MSLTSLLAFSTSCSVVELGELELGFKLVIRFFIFSIVLENRVFKSINPVVLTVNATLLEFVSFAACVNFFNKSLCFVSSLKYFLRRCSIMNIAPSDRSFTS